MQTDPLLQVLVEFFDLPPGTSPAAINQQTIPAWDSLAMVQLITELQGRFAVEFGLDEIEALRSYDEIRVALVRKGKLASEEPASQS